MHRRISTFAIAGAVAAAVAAACQGHLDPPIDAAPLPPGPAEVTVDAATIPPGADLPMHATGLTPGASVAIGMGLPASDYDVIRHARADERGELHTRIQVPGWAMRGHAYVVVVAEADGEARAVSEPFVVGAPGDRVEVVGTVTDEGVECPAVRGVGGALYTLAVAGFEHAPGTDVVVEGTIAGATICMQGTTLDVERVRAR